MTTNDSAAPKYMAVPELAAAGAGAITYWRLSSKPLDHDALKGAWLAAGLPEGLLLGTPEPATALGRAVSEQRGKHRLVRSVRGTHVIVSEKAGKTVDRPGDVDYAAEATVKLDKLGRVEVTPSYHRDLREEISKLYEESLGLVTGGDVATWLSTKVIAHVQGVSLRPSGGMYFVPREQVALWDRVVAVLREVSEHRILQIPALESSKAVEAVLDAIEQEAEAEADRLRRKLDEGKMGSRAFETAIGECSGVMAKVERYESLLGVKLDGLRGKLDSLGAALTVAARKGEAAADV